MAKYEHIVTTEEQGLSITQIIKANYRFSARFKTKMKYQQLVDLDGKPTPGYIKPNVGSVISIRLPEESSDFPAEDIPISILYEDDDLLVVDKQPGLTVHPTKGHPNHTLANGLMKYMADSGMQFKIRFANRLDMDTSGIVLVAKSGNVQDSISNQMRRKTIVKRYNALVIGNIANDHFVIDLPIGRPFEDQVQRAVMPVGGKDALTEVRVLDRFGSPDADQYTLVELTLHTGRTHQIRVHLSHIGYPIVGDHLYGGTAPDIIERQALHACYIELEHPITGDRLKVSSELPADILDAIERVKNASR